MVPGSAPCDVDIRDSADAFSPGSWLDSERWGSLVPVGDLRLSTLPTVPPYVFTDDMESGSGKWSSNGAWSIGTDLGAWSNHWMDSPRGNYGINWDYWIATNTVDLSRTTPGKVVYLLFDLKLEVEPDYDTLWVEISKDNGANWEVLDWLDGAGEGYLAYEITSDYLTSGFKLRFRLETDDSYCYDGAHIDNVALLTDPDQAVEQNDVKITYVGDWSKDVYQGSASVSTVHTANKAGAMAVVSFTGPGLFWYATTGPGYGRANVSVDGGPAEKVDLYSSSYQYEQAVWDSGNLSDGPHQVNITWLNEKIYYSWGTTINIDAFDVWGSLTQSPAVTRVDDNDATCTSYGPAWSRWDASGYWAAYLDTYAFTDQETYKMMVSFEGAYLSWISRTANTQGKAKVSLYAGDVDPGNLVSSETVDLYSSATTWKKSVYNTGMLTDGAYTVVIECLGEKNPASWWYTIGVDAFDIIGTPVAPPLVLLTTRYQQSDAKITYLGDWTTSNNASASGGSFASSRQAGAAALAKFTGTEVSVLASTGPAQGEADIYVDDVLVDTVDLYSATTAWKVPIYSDDTLAHTAHTVAIECTGTKNPSSSGIAVSLDALEIAGTLDQAATPTRVDDNDAGYAAYDPAWSRWDASGYWAAYLDTYAFTDQATYKVTVTFHGTHLSWVSRTANTQGKAKVTLDGNDAGAVTIDLYSPSTLWKKRVYSTGLLTDDTHTVVIECLGTKNPASWWYSIGVDAFDVMVTTL